MRWHQQFQPLIIAWITNWWRFVTHYSFKIKYQGNNLSTNSQRKQFQSPWKINDLVDVSASTKCQDMHKTAPDFNSHKFFMLVNMSNKADKLFFTWILGLNLSKTKHRVRLFSTMVGKYFGLKTLVAFRKLWINNI